MDWIVRLPSALYRLSVKKAGGDRELQAHIRGYLESWVNAETNQAIAANYWMTGKALAGARIYCADCQQVHAPGPCPRVT